VPISMKLTVAAAPVLLFLAAAVAAWFLGPWSPPEPASLVPVGYITLRYYDVDMSDTKLNPPARSQACTVIGVNNSGTTIDSILCKFSTQAELTFAGDSNGFRSRVGELRATRPLMPGGRTEYVTLPAPGTIESVELGWGESAKTHAVATPLAAGKRLVISYEPGGKVSTRME
jgi:hypothetical protein